MTTRADLKPKQKQLVGDILTTLNLPPPRTNYEWCFGSADSTCVMFQWFDQIEEDANGQIFFLEGSAAWASANAGIAETIQIRRAEAVHDLVNNAFIKKRPIRVAIVDGDIKKVKLKETGQAKWRVLDEELWWPHHKDAETGQIVVIRGVPQPANFEPLADYVALLSGEWKGEVSGANQDQIPDEDENPNEGTEDVRDESPDQDQPQDQSEDPANDFDPNNIEDAREWINASIVRRQGQGKFRFDLLSAYANRCAISACDVPAALEAAHIFPYLGTDTNIVANGLLLRADLHSLYDLGRIAIDPASMRVVIAPQLNGTDYSSLNGAMIKLPIKVEQRPNQAALAKHLAWAKSTWE